jgi:hypothetical protein
MYFVCRLCSFCNLFLVPLTSQRSRISRRYKHVPHGSQGSDVILFTGIVITVSSSSWSEAEKDEQSSQERKLNRPIQCLFLSLLLIRMATTLLASMKVKPKKKSCLSPGSNWGPFVPASHQNGQTLLAPMKVKKKNHV